MESTDPGRLEMVTAMLDAISYPIYTFDRNRKIIYSNKAARQQQTASTPGKGIGAAEINHFEENEYYDEFGESLPPAKLQILERAFKGEETRNLLIEHRNVKNKKHKWLEVTCIPVLNNAGFSYGILMSRDVSPEKKRDDKLKFLVESTKILSITIEFHNRLKKKASLVVPSLADWCSIEIINSEKKIVREALIHRDPKKIELIQMYEETYPNKPGIESATERVIRTGKGEFTPLVTQEMIDKVPGLKKAQKKAIEQLQLSSIMILPIGLPGKVLGALTLAYAESGRLYTEEDFRFFSEFAQHLSVLLDNARLYNEIRFRDESKDVFLASLSHELRNPLAPIRSSLDLLQLQNRDETLDPEIQIIEHQLEHMSHLLNDLLDTTRFIKGRIRLELVPVELMEVVKQVVAAMQPVAHENGISLSFKADAPSYMVLADSVRLEQAFTNLISNALKFTTRDGKIRISLEKNKNAVIIKVHDTGAGITSEEMTRIFEPYYQSQRVQGANTGLGIGLRLVYEIVQLHLGTVTVESKGKDLGSTFIVTIPLASAANKQRKTKPLEIIAELAKDKMIMVVDDNHAAADGVVKLLTAMNWNAQALYNGTDFLSAIAEQPPDIAFVDIGMPGMNGYEIIKELRSKGNMMPVIALTGYGLTEDKEEALAAGFTAHLTKPIGAKELRLKLSELL